eukprot:5864117-Amphidinium_carterae.1
MLIDVLVSACQDNANIGGVLCHGSGGGYPSDTQGASPSSTAIKLLTNKLVHQSPPPQLAHALLNISWRNSDKAIRRCW